MHILVLAYAISPTRGSEYSVAWNYVTRMSKYHKLTVLYGCSGNHIGDCEEIERYATVKGIHNVDFSCVKSTKWVNILNWCNKKGFLGYTFYLAYKEWHKLAYKKAIEIVSNNTIDLVHYLGPIGFREPGYLWKLGLPYMWGPIGGANKTSITLQRNLPKISKLKFKFRNWATSRQLNMNRLTAALQHTDLLLTCTTENKKVFHTIHHKESIYLPENSISGDICINQEKFIAPEVYKFIVIGNLIDRKSVNILFEALCLVKHKEKIVIDIVGDGPMRKSLEEYAKDNLIYNLIKWHGMLSRQKAVEMFKNAHMHIITSISEGNATTIWEAMSYGVPTLSFDHCGMHDTLSNGAGILVPISHKYSECVKALAREIDSLIMHPNRFKQLAESTIECAKKCTWDEREKILLHCYKMTIKKHMNGSSGN